MAVLRLNAGRFSEDRGISDLVGEFSGKSPEFTGWWANQRVRAYSYGKNVSGTRWGPGQVKYLETQLACLTVSLGSRPETIDLTLGPVSDLSKIPDPIRVFVRFHHSRILTYSASQ
ncbi:hypothetical protein [Mycetocola lacteus]|uniref:MmyB family transcriptional regulator n=1 Tax=Mycetocola lacteus TaxID=76637 RepID=UPI0015FF2AD4